MNFFGGESPFMAPASRRGARAFAVKFVSVRISADRRNKG